ncbi:hypothetical protein [Microbacterium sp.]|uniref:hypothetical protein n=1 Tax=Microbacterium sp. TaxID=51671 RepID=UPI003F9E7499
MRAKLRGGTLGTGLPHLAAGRCCGGVRGVWREEPLADQVTVVSVGITDRVGVIAPRLPVCELFGCFGSRPGLRSFETFLADGEECCEVTFGVVGYDVKVAALTPMGEQSFLVLADLLAGDGQAVRLSCRFLGPRFQPRHRLRDLREALDERGEWDVALVEPAFNDSLVELLFCEDVPLLPKDSCSYLLA